MATSGRGAATQPYLFKVITRTHHFFLTVVSLIILLLLTDEAVDQCANDGADDRGYPK